MAWDKEIDLSVRKFSSRLIVERALARGWRVRGFETNPAIFLIYIPGRPKPIKVFSASPSQMSYPAAKIAKDKHITSEILATEGLPVPKEILLSADELEADSEKISDFIKESGYVVVKPLDASHGKGITVGIDSYDVLDKVVQKALKESDKTHVLIQQQITGYDIRILCIGYKFINSITRIPASVVGDDQHTIEELIDITNQSPERGENYRAKLNYIPKAETEEFIGSEKLKDRPKTGEVVQVIGVSNVGMGGERKNIKENIPAFLKDLAERAATILELPVCGVDFLVSKLPTADMSQSELNPLIIEVNECPMLTMYDDLYSAEQLSAIDRYLDYIAS